ncbi:glutamate ABC transporter substrate-binding protein [Pseudonocardia sp. HH130630-07]|uniref:glutamate ABC transporter substrate-binding protein n=1 Tax=Pseudonocardia sp. HH130630-07 TaxID=1690815 RepID=UPI0008152630|nr:glutamate ABC transporter substrate-binding protein [Pseudonocardia sp. HH130630-07]ANY08419.1 glutamate-binding protein [Pseudonocardia sp. HH130630-07]
MRLSRLWRTATLTAVAALTLSACGGGGGGADDAPLPERAQSEQRLTVGIKFDQPALGLRQPDGSYAGFDVDVAKYVAKELGVPEDGIEFVEAQSAERENLIDRGEVDFIVATYSITPAREERVSFGGPYFIAKQDLLVRSDASDITGPQSLNNNKKLCSVRGSTPAQKVKDEYAQNVQLQEFGKYSDCITALLNGTVDAVTTDDVILAGYAAQNPGKLKVVGQGFSEEKYGVGLRKDDTAGRSAVNAALQKMIDDGSWERSLQANVGPSGYTIPAPPQIPAG